EGKNQIYLYDFQGNRKKLTSDKNEVTGVYGFDANRKKVYYQATDGSPLKRALFSVDLEGKVTNLSGERYSGWNSALFSTTYDYYVLVHSTANIPPVYSVYTLDGKLIRVIESNDGLNDRIREYGFQPKEFFTFEN